MPRPFGEEDRQIGITALAIASALIGAPVPMPAPAFTGHAIPAAPTVGVDQDASARPPSPSDPAAPTTPADQVRPSPSATPPDAAADARAPTAGQAGDVVVIGRDRRDDPLSAVNERSFAVTQAVDDAVIGPVARTYKREVPSTIRSGLRNFIANLREPVAALNYLLQLKPGKAAETVGRFAVNTTIGAAGLFDVAKKRPFNLPRRRNSLANTLGYYGVKPGPFLFLPLIGPVTVRDLVGNIVDQLAIPVTSVPPLDNPAVTIPLLNIGAIDFRAENDERLTKIKASADPYAAVRRAYLERRTAEIDALRGPRRTRGGPPIAGPIPPPDPTPRVIAIPVARPEDGSPRADR
ncbi:VacJ family lipoprotein [uncultured Sphingomonas sp.]|uniref:MlaA family lipoprotein n=1 Tax=uncultured Sphingomonas sp. TaxID=158754 RepID=UPI0035CAEBC1